MVTRAIHPCAGCAAHAAGLFCDLDTPVGRQLQAQRTVHAFRRGQTIFHEGMEPTALFVISAGRVKLTSLWKGGEEHVLRLHGIGEFLGYRALLANEPYHASAEAVEDTTLCVFPTAAVRRALREAPEMASGLLELLAREMRRSEDLLLDLLHRRAPQRVARLLLAMAAWNAAGPSASIVWSAGLTHRSMAMLIGTTPETFSRVLTALKRRRILAVERDRIEILDAAALRRAADLDPDQAGA